MKQRSTKNMRSIEETIGMRMVAVGLVVNLGLGWQVWDYGKEFGNFLGQICPLFSFYWFLLCYALLGGIRLVRRRREAAAQSGA